MKKTLIVLLLVAVVIGAGVIFRRSQALPNEKVYVAVEAESKVVAINSSTGKVISVIDLLIEHDGGKMPYAPHNVQVSPDMKTVWVSANAGSHQNHSSLLAPAKVYAHGEVSEGSDEVIIINPRTDQIIKRLPIEVGLHLAHIVLAPDSSYALVTSQNKGLIYKINAKTYEVEKVIAMPGGDGAKSEPHGLRIAPNGLTSYIAALGAKTLASLNLQTYSITSYPLGGSPVQTGVTPDGKIVMASLYDTKELALYYPSTGLIKKVKLPASSRGPVQMYPTPDSKFVYLADQGYYFGQPNSEWIYKIDLKKLSVVKEIKAGNAPHGVVVSPDGATVYVTNLLSNDVSVIDVATDTEISRIPVGSQPNGISIWTNNN